MWEGPIFPTEGVGKHPGRRCGKASVPQGERLGRRQFIMKKVWEGVSSI